MREKDGEKARSPMFPRLRVNDTEQGGGPRAPPRNKMALYEQFSILSQRFSIGSASASSLPPTSGTNLVPSISSNHGGDHQRNVFGPFGNTSAHSYFSEKSLLYSTSGVRLNTTVASKEWKSTKPTSYQSLDTIGSLSPAAVCIAPGKDWDNVPRLNLNSTIHLQTTSEKQIKGTGNLDLKSTQYIRNQVPEIEEASQTSQDHVERSASLPSTMEQISGVASSKLPGKIKISESLKQPNASLNELNKSSSVNAMNSLENTKASSNQERRAMRDETALGDSILMESTSGKDKGIFFKVSSEPCKGPSIRNTDLSFNGSGRECFEDQNCASVNVRDLGRHDDVSDTSWVDSWRVRNVSPDDVACVMGKKHYWRARSTIANQQRVFALQVFELHRLIKVQRLIAGSPHLLLGDNFIVGKPSLIASPVKKLPSKYIQELPPAVKLKDQSHKSNPGIECADENAVPKLTLPPVNNGTSKEFVTQQPSYEPYSGNRSPISVTTNTKPSPWCFLPLGNQWLVPVMSPSEGLIYKPYTGPCPPATGLTPPVYDSHALINQNACPGVGEFFNMAYGVPASHKRVTGILPGTPPWGQTYSPPYGMPVVNPASSSTVVDQVGLFAGARSRDSKLLGGDADFTRPLQSFCNRSSQMSRETSCGFGKFQESEVQGSTASSSCQRAAGDELPLFPTEPAAQATDQNTQTTKLPPRVIKVIPHNPRSASESAARIFQSIQEQRKTL